MTIVSMKGYKVKELKFVNKHENGVKIQFTNKVSYNVRYTKNNICFGELSVEMFDKQAPEKFGVNLILDGFFEFDTQAKKETIHVSSFKELYPLAKSIVASVSVNAGIPPLILPPFDIESQAIYKFDKNNFGKKFEEDEENEN